MKIVVGKIQDVNPDGLTIFVPYKDWGEFTLKQFDEVEVGLRDGRGLSAGQRAKAYAMMKEIADYVGELPEVMKHYLKMEFMATRMEELKKHIFSLSDCDMTTATEFISFLIDFMVEHNIPSKVPLAEQSEDIQHYIYSCLYHKRCCICQRKADLHHVDRVGMGNNRKEIIHEGMQALPLCRVHHTECHTMSQDDFNAKYHLESIPLDKKLCQRYGLKTFAE